MDRSKEAEKASKVAAKQLQLSLKAAAGQRPSVAGQARFPQEVVRNPGSERKSGPGCDRGSVLSEPRLILAGRPSPPGLIPTFPPRHRVAPVPSSQPKDPQRQSPPSPTNSSRIISVPVLRVSQVPDAESRHPRPCPAHAAPATSSGLSPRSVAEL